MRPRPDTHQKRRNPRITGWRSPDTRLPDYPVIWSPDRAIHGSSGYSAARLLGHPFTGSRDRPLIGACVRNRRVAPSPLIGACVRNRLITRSRDRAITRSSEPVCGIADRPIGEPRDPLPVSKLDGPLRRSFLEERICPVYPICRRLSRLFSRPPRALLGARLRSGAPSPSFPTPTREKPP